MNGSRLQLRAGFTTKCRKTERRRPTPAKRHKGRPRQNEAHAQNRPPAVKTILPPDPQILGISAPHIGGVFVESERLVLHTLSY